MQNQKSPPELPNSWRTSRDPSASIEWSVWNAAMGWMVDASEIFGRRPSTCSLLQAVYHRLPSTVYHRLPPSTRVDGRRFTPQPHLLSTP